MILETLPRRPVWFLSAIMKRSLIFPHLNVSRQLEAAKEAMLWLSSPSS